MLEPQALSHHAVAAPASHGLHSASKTGGQTAVALGSCCLPSCGLSVSHLRYDDHTACLLFYTVLIPSPRTGTPGRQRAALAPAVKLQKAS